MRLGVIVSGSVNNALWGQLWASFLLGVEPLKPKSKVQMGRCLECQQSFVKHRDWQKFCTPRCRMNHFTAKRALIIKEYNERMAAK